MKNLCLKLAMPLCLLVLLTACANNKYSYGESSAAESSDMSFEYTWGDGFNYQAPASISKQDVMARIAKAETLLEMTQAQEITWRHTIKNIKEAKAKLKEGDNASAYKSASKAIFETESALQQSAKNKDEWQLAFPR